MHSLSLIAMALASVCEMASGQGVIVSAKGNTGTSVAMQVQIDNLADANYINQAEIESNAVNACGRTFLGGDISEAGQTEEILESGTYTTVTKGSTLTVTVSQRFSNGSGPFTCDLDESSNALGAYGQTNLTVSQDTSEFGTGNLTLAVALPSNLTCIGGSTGNMCTVRCVNTQSFGGCITIQQTDVTANVNTVDNIVTEERKDAIAAQVTQNQKDLDAANKGLAAASTTEEEAVKVVEAILSGDEAIDAANGNIAASGSTSAAVVAAVGATSTVTVTVNAATASVVSATTSKNAAARASRASARKSKVSAARASVSAASTASALVTATETASAKANAVDGRKSNLRWAARRRE